MGIHLDAGPEEFRIKQCDFKAECPSARENDSLNNDRRGGFNLSQVLASSYTYLGSSLGCERTIESVSP